MINQSMFGTRPRGEQQRTFKHDATVTSVAFLGDTSVVSASKDKTVRIWSQPTGECRKLAGHSAAVNCLAVSPDERFILSGSTDKTVVIWETKTGERVATLRNDEPVVSVDWSTNGNCVAAGGSGGGAKVWAVEWSSTQASVGEEVSSAITQVKHRYDIDAGKGHVRVAFHPGNKRLATSSNRLSLWDVQTGQEAFTFSHLMGGTFAVSFSPSGGRLLATRHNKTLIWETSDGGPFRVP